MTENSKDQVAPAEVASVTTKYFSVDTKVLIDKFAKKGLAWLSIWAWGYWGFSPGYLLAPLFLNIIRYQWKKERNFKLSSAQSLADTNREKEVILARVQDLPSWVFFPDYERSEWVNRVVSQLWPSIGHFVSNLLTTEVEGLIRKKLEDYKLGGFKFTNITLGNIPPRTGGIKCYHTSHNISRNEIIVDIDVTWAGDCDMQVSIKQMKASIVDLYIHGLLRVVLKPLIHSLPLVGGIQVFFLNNPSVDFSLGGVANMVDMPGVGSILRRVIQEQIAAFIVLPNKFSVPFVDNIPRKVFKCPEPSGVLRINLVEARNLMKMDRNWLGHLTKSDPYAVITVGANEYKSEIIKGTVDPEWNETWEVEVEIVKGQKLTIELFDWDQGVSDDFLGRASIPIGNLVRRGSSDMWITVEDAESGRLRIRTQWLLLTTDINDYRESLQEAETHQFMGLGHSKNERLCSAVLLVYVDSCKLLPLTKAGSKPDPVVQVGVRGKESKETWPVLFSRNPVYEQGFVFLVNNPEVDEFMVRVYDQKTRSDLGLLKLSLASLIKRPDMEYLNQPFKLVGASHESSITLHLKLHFIRKKEKAADSEFLAKKESFDIPNCMEAKDEILVHTQDEVDVQNDTPHNIMDEEVTTNRNTLRVPRLSKTHSRSSSVGSGRLSIGSLSRSPSPESRAVSWKSWNGSLTSLASALSPKKDHNSVDVKSSVIDEDDGIRGPRILVSANYKESQDVNLLTVTIHRATALPADDPCDPPNPFVKLVLLPDRPKAKKTDYIKDSFDPVWEAAFQFNIPHEEIKQKELELTVIDKKGLFTRHCEIGRTYIELENLFLEDQYSFTKWFPLHNDGTPKIGLSDLFVKNAESSLVTASTSIILDNKSSTNYQSRNQVL